MATQIIEIGALFITAAGEYSSYQVVCLMQATETIDIAKTWDKWLATGKCGVRVSLEHWLVNVARVARELPMQEWRKGWQWNEDPWSDDLNDACIKCYSGRANVPPHRWRLGVI